MIVKNEENSIANAIDSVKDIADEIVVVDTGSTDKTKEILSSYEKVKVFDLALDPFHFGDARQFSFEKCTSDWILWIDADDVLENPQGVLDLVKENNKLVSAYAAIYNYAFDKSGICTSRHWKERLIRNDNSLEWAGVVHEAMIPRRQVNVLQTDKFSIKHCKDDDDWRRSSERNYEIARGWVDDDDLDSADPRNIFNLANSLFGLQRFEEAFKYYNEFTKRSGWNEEIYMALHRMAACARMLNRLEAALNCEFQALTVDPKIRDAYIGIGQTYMMLEEWDKAEHWLKLSFSREAQKPSQVHNPAEYTFNPWWFLGHVYTNMAMENRGYEYVVGAIECFEKCKKVMPNDKELDGKLLLLNEVKRDQELADAAVLLGAVIQEDAEKMQQFVGSLPATIHKHPAVWKMRNSTKEPRKATGKDVMIWCGNCFEPWDPTYLDTGCGGSEEAVIHMARELTELGFNVTVFNSIAEETVFDGVTYMPWYHYNMEDEYDVFISWRQPQVFDVMKPKAKKIYLWLHDVMQDGEFTPERLEMIDKVFVLSEYHRSLFPSIPDEKIWLSANGLHLPDMEVDVERQPMRLINTSAPDRGIHCLLKMWPEIKETYPTAELHWFYGWQTYDNYNKDNPERMALKNEIVKMFEELPDVYDHGRVGHKEIAKEMAMSDIWVYPTEFPEISCISAMKAQALGCIPVCTNVAALNETVQSGIKLDYDKIYSDKDAQAAFITAIGESANLDRATVREAGASFDWKNVAKDWAENML